MLNAEGEPVKDPSAPAQSGEDTPATDAAGEQIVLSLHLLVNADKSRIRDILATAGLEHARDRKVKNFSLGMKQRLALALALLNEPEILMLDEPVNGLDPIGINEIRELLKKINAEKGTTIVVSSHYLGELEKLAKTFGILEQGRLVSVVTAEQLAASVSSCVRITVANSLADTVKAVEAIGRAGYKVLRVQNDVIFAEGGQDEILEYGRILAENGVGIRSIESLKEDFESYFIRLIKGEGK